MKHLLSITAALLTLAVLSGCDNARPPGSSTQHKVSDGTTESKVKVEAGKPGIDAETKARKEAEKAKITAKIDGTDANIKVLEDHAAKETGDAKKKIDDEIKDMQKKRDDLHKQYDKIDTTEASGWDNFVTELHKAADSLNESSKKAADRFKK